MRLKSIVKQSCSFSALKFFRYAEFSRLKRCCSRSRNHRELILVSYKTSIILLSKSVITPLNPPPLGSSRTIGFAFVQKFLTFSHVTKKIFSAQKTASAHFKMISFKVNKDILTMRLITSNENSCKNYFKIINP